jgi:hypothetical protein
LIAPNRPIWTKLGITNADRMRYCLQMAPYVLPAIMTGRSRVVPTHTEPTTYRTGRGAYYRRGHFN